MKPRPAALVRAFRRPWVPLLAMICLTGLGPSISISPAQTGAAAPAAEEPRTPDEWAARAQQLLTGGSLNEAIDAFDRAVIAGPERLDIRLAYAGILKEAMLWLRSAAQYRAVLAAEPDDAGALMGYGELLTAEYQFAAAAEQFRRALQTGLDGNALTRAQLDLGKSQFGMEDYAAAARTFSAVLESNPDSPTTMAYLAITRRKLGDLEEARKLWDRLLILDPGAPPALIHRNEIEALRAAIDRARIQVQSQPTNAEAWADLGRWLRKQPDLPGAEQALAAAVRLRPEIDRFRFVQGAVQRDRSRWPEAAASFASVGKDPRYGALARYNLAHVLRRLGDRPGETDAWKGAVDLNPYDFYAYERYVGALHGTPGFELERVAVTRAMQDETEAGKETTTPRIRLAIVQRAAGDLQAARRSALDALRVDPNDVHAQWILRDLVRLDEPAVRAEAARLDSPAGARPGAARVQGALLLALGRETEAETEFRKVLAASPKDTRTMVALASCVKARDGIDAALPLLEAAVKEAPGDLYARLELALVLLEVGRIEDATAASRAAIDLAPRHPLGYSLMGSALRLKGDLQAAARVLEEAVALDPMDSTGAPRLMLAKVYGAMGRDEEARERLVGDLPEDPDEIYHMVWEFVRDNYKDRTFHGQDWRVWERRFEGRLRTTPEALGAVAMMLASLDDRNTRLRSADQTARLLFSERSGAAEFAPSGIALSNSRTVETRHLEDGTGYVAVTNLDDPRATADIRKALESVSTDKGVILDLRGNQGGADNDVSRIVGMVVPPGTETGTVVGPDGKIVSKASPATPSGEPIIGKDRPIVVLVDRNTASSAENIAGSLKESRRAVLVGEKTYGKSGIQMPRLLPGGTIALVVVADRGDLSGAVYTGSGIVPDVSVAGASRGSGAPDDPALDRAREILRRRKPGS